MTTTFDATPMITLPTGLPLLPLGTFDLQIPVPQVAQQTCIDTAYYAAWSCTIPMNIPYLVTVSLIPNAPNDLRGYNISLLYGNNGNNTFGGWYAYGSQPPLITTVEPLTLVIDSQEPARGPAWFFELKYDKLVVVPGSTFTAPTTSKRHEHGGHYPGVHDRDQDDHPLMYGGFTRKSVVQPGDKPWFCYWNNTLLEAFIYVSTCSL